MVSTAIIKNRRTLEVRTTNRLAGYQLQGAGNEVEPEHTVATKNNERSGFEERGLEKWAIMEHEKKSM